MPETTTLVRLGDGQNPCRGVHSDASNVVALELDLAVNSRTCGQSVVSGDVEHGRGAPDRAGRVLEADEETVASRLDLAAVEPLDPHARGLVVLAEKRAPARVTELAQRLCGSRKVREDDRRKIPLGWLCRRPREQSAAGEVDRSRRLVADDPRHMPGRHFKHVAGTELDRRSIVHVDVELARDHVPEVVELARGRADDRLDMVGPSPARFEDSVPDGGIPELNEFDPGLLDGPHLVGTVEPLAPQLHEPIVADEHRHRADSR
jgi:hypothetical protein